MVYLYLLIASLSWASLDLVRKVSLAKASYSGIIILMAIGQVLTFLVWFFVSSLSFAVSPDYFLWGGVSILMNLIVPLIFLKGLKSGYYSQTLPFIAFVPVVTLLIAKMIGEQATLLQSAGVLFVFIGGLCLSHGKRGSSRNFFMRRVEALTMNRGALYMLCAAIIWGALVVVDKIVLQSTAAQVHGLCISTSICVCYVLIHWWRNEAPLLVEFRELPISAYTIPFLAGAALTFTFLTIQSFEVAFFEAINRTTTVIMSIVAGALFFKEEVRLQQVLSVMIMCVGVAVILI